MGTTSPNVRWRSIATTLAMAMLLALTVAPPAAFAHRGEHNVDKSDADGQGIGVEVLSGPAGLAEFLAAYQWAGTPAVDDEGTPEFQLAYVPGGCTPADYAAVDVEGKIALVDQAAALVCPPSTFFQKVQYAQQAGATGFLQVPTVQARSNATAITADIPALDLIRVTETNDNGTPDDKSDDREVATQDDAADLRDAVKAGETVTVRFIDRRTVYPSTSRQPCENGFAGDTAFRCDGVDLLGFISQKEFNSAGISDLWGWSDRGDDGEGPVEGEYVIMGKTNGVAFFNVTDPTAPVYLGELDNPGLIHAVWHDIKVYDNHAFIVSESENHGMTVFDLTKLRGLDASDPAAPREFEFDARYQLTSAAHNLEINEEIGMAYILGGNAGIVAPDHCLSGLHMVDINDPKNPTFRGCYVLEGGPGTAARAAGSPVTDLSPAAYVHDAQCVVYDEGPDEDHHGKHICVTAAENKIVTVDVTNPAAPITLGTSVYEHVAYAHQGWFDETESYWFVNDELAQMTFPEDAPETRTIVMDLRDLDNPKPHFDYLPPNPLSDTEPMKAITHNNYVVGDHLFQSNYASGLRVADISGVAEGEMTEVAWFDTFPSNDGTNFDGTWSNYPFFESGTIAVSGRAEGLFLLKLAEEEALGVEVACEGCPVEIRAGETGQAHIGVQNTGDVTDTYEVTVDGLPWDWSATAEPVTVAAGEHGHTDLVITVPRNAQAGSYTFTVIGTSTADPRVSDTAKVVVEVVKGKPSDAGKPGDGGRPGTTGQAATAAAPTVVAATAAGASTAPAGDGAVPAALLLALAVGLVTSSVIRRRSTD
ncbi:MAG: choice-of-anchor B family protein [Actinobacteria bacterium]|nr:choice-of-anchor B family protein [Actinomycetota bacterium]